MVLSAVALDTDLVLTFNEDMAKGTGNITIMKDDDSIFEQIDMTSANVTISGAEVTINPTENFENDTDLSPENSHTVT
jgi:hypothetical protein